MGKQKVIEVVDTNVILRYLVGGNKPQQKKAKEWLKEAEQGERRILVKPLIVAEACFVLESFYKKGRNDIASVFEVFLSQKWIQVEDRKTILHLWGWYRRNLHFVDSYLLSWLKTQKGKLLSFDSKLINKI